MASLALGFAGQAVGGAFGGPIGAKIGGFIGSTLGGLLDNTLFGGSKVEGPRLEDKRVQVSTYGATLPVIYGPENRLSGLVIWSTGLLETAKKTKQGGKGGPTVSTTSYSYRVSFAVALADRPCSSIVKVWANQILIYDRDGTGSPPVTENLFTALRFYPGDGVQLPDPTIESYLGVGQTPAYRHTAYMVIEDLQLADFGNRLPNIEVLLEADASINLPVIINDICVRCGANPNDIGISGLDGITVRGYAITGSARGTDAIQPLALAFAFDAAEQGGNLRFVARGLAPRGVIPLDDMGAYQGFDSYVPEPVRFELVPPVSLPKEAVVTFSDPERDHQRSSQPSRRQFGDADSNLSYDLPVVLSNDEGRRIADRMLWEAWTSRRAAAWTGNDRWRSARPGDLYFVEGPTGLTLIRITRALRGVNGLIQFESREDDAVIYQSNALGVPGAIPVQEIVGIPVVDVILLDIPLLLDADLPTSEGFYFGLVANGPGWRGANLLRAIAEDGVYSEVLPQGVELILGEVDFGDLAGLPDGFDTALDWDDTSVITVVPRRADMELESSTDAEVLAGANAAYVGPANGFGGEVIQFVNAVLNPDGSYTLSRFRRAQRGTDAEAAVTHGFGELFVLLEPGALLRVNLGFGDLNQERWFKAVPLLGTADEAPSVPFTNTGVGLRPYAPVLLGASRPASPDPDIALVWTRRSRVGGDLVPPPLAEDVELYTLQILDGASPPTVVREVEVSTPSFTYTEADQIADFGAPPAALNWRVAQVSGAYGNGTFAASSGPV